MDGRKKEGSMDRWMMEGWMKGKKEKKGVEGRKRKNERWTDGWLDGRWKNG